MYAMIWEVLKSTPRNLRIRLKCDQFCFAAYCSTVQPTSKTNFGSLGTMSAYGPYQWVSLNHTVDKITRRLFSAFSEVWCFFMFPLKPPAAGIYPWYPTCNVRSVLLEFRRSKTGFWLIHMSDVNPVPSVRPIFKPNKRFLSKIIRMGLLVVSHSQIFPHQFLVLGTVKFSSWVFRRRLGGG